jgi:hypothetical protein
MLRLADTILLALGRYRPWARERMVYRALALTADREPAEERSLDRESQRRSLRESNAAVVRR